MFRQRIAPISVSLIALLLLVSFVPTGLVPQAHAARDIGGLDLSWYCDAKYDVWPWQDGNEVLREPRNAYSWRCNVDGVDVGIDMNEVCRWQYGSDTWAETHNWQDSGSWRCYWEVYVPPYYA